MSSLHTTRRLLQLCLSLVLLPLLRTVNANKTEVVGCTNVANIKCKPGVMLPSWGEESDSDGAKAARAFVYMISMFFFFLGISIISDRFMAAIEIITSQEKDIKVRDPVTGQKRVVTVKIWNETVSNLTLMALGSSAPEILLSVIEICGRNFQAGELGPSTIVGSAAFNLFIITSVCTACIPEGEVRRIAHLRVFAFTATFSVFAYIWMYLIISVMSPGVIEVWEGIITLLYFPLFVIIAYLIDTKVNFYRYLRKKVRKSKMHGQTVIQTGDGDIVQVSVADGGKYPSQDLEKNHNEIEMYDRKPMYVDGEDFEELEKNDISAQRKKVAMEAYHRAKAKYPDADAETLSHLVEQESLKLQHKSRAFYRIEATRKMTGSGSVLKPKEKETQKMHSIAESPMELKDVAHNIPEGGSAVFFNPPEYTVIESCGHVFLTVVRAGEEMFSTVYVDYKTEDGTAKSGSDFEATEGTLVFNPGETSKTISIAIVDDEVFELDEHFFVKLTGIRTTTTEGAGGLSRRKFSSSCKLGEPAIATITILDDDYPGVFTIEQAKYEIMETIGVLSIKIIRLLGARGIVRIPFHTSEGSAKGGGEDYEDVVGEVEFKDEETSKTIDIPVLDREEYEKRKTFEIVLGHPKSIQVGSQSNIPDCSEVEDEEIKRIIEAGKPTLGDIKSAEVTITECREFRNTIDKMLKKTNVALVLGTSSWREQFREAIQVSSGDDEDEDASPSYGDYVMHYISLFWKVLFAFVPPTDMMGGWACFTVAILMIGILTAITGDLASHFGCTVGLADSVVAISFVALGTSLPDTFASKVAALNDETADSSIGNVTGSNSVNVFLGIGVAWSVASIYHTANGNEFRVEGGSLGFSVLVFCVLALICISMLMWRRTNKKIGGELGGPQPIKGITSVFLAMLWVTYILMSSLESYCYIKGF